MLSIDGMSIVVTGISIRWIGFCVYVEVYTCQDTVHRHDSLPHTQIYAFAFKRDQIFRTNRFAAVIDTVFLWIDQLIN